MEIDLNCDLGEGCPHDAELMPLITSANVCCGAHAGDAETSLATLRLAARHGVKVGAHPGFADREHFGRRELNLPPEHIVAECVHQIGALAGLARVANVALAYVKPHGALYNMAAREDAIAEPVVRAAAVFALPIMGLPGSRLEGACSGRVPFIAEGFADRRYRPDGSLVPRTDPNAMIHDPDEAVRQAEQLVSGGCVRTLCVHGDNPKAIEFVRALRDLLIHRGITLRSFQLA